MIATAALAGHLLAEADFSSSDRRRATGMYWMTAALVAPVMNAVFFIIPPSVVILLNLACPFTACISSVLLSTWPYRRRGANAACNVILQIFLFWLILAKISEILKERYVDFLLAAR